MPFENESPAPADPVHTPPRRTFFRGLNALLVYFSPSERLLLYTLTLVLGLSAFALVGHANDRISTEVPTEGGEIVEGGVGTPRFVNPVLAVTPTDEDLTILVYSGLVRAVNGSFVPDLAERFEISEDGTTYTFHLRDGLVFHDGTPLTAEDVLFSVALAQNPDVKSPKRADWDGVVANAPDSRTVVFTLPHAYAPFIEIATLGILPEEQWKDVAASELPFHALNTRPIGSGPYALHDVELDPAGAPLEYKLRASPSFALGEPHITRITYRTFPTEDALFAAFDDNDISSFLALSPKSVQEHQRDEGTFHRIPLTRIFGIFLNQNQAPILADASVREALDAAIDKEKIVSDVLGGFGEAIDAPVPAGLLPTATTTPDADYVADAQAALKRGGWILKDANSTTSQSHWAKGESVLSIALALPDTADIVASAEAVAEAWRAAGIGVELEIYPLSEFNQTVLRPRLYDAILFGEVVGRSLDLFPFWHSSQRNDPGLNFSLYTNSEADRALASARGATDRAARESSIRELLAQLDEDAPAVFLYSPEAAYLLPANIHGVNIDPVLTAAERFTEIHTWYRDTERVWDVFK